MNAVLLHLESLRILYRFTLTIIVLVAVLEFTVVIIF